MKMQKGQETEMTAAPVVLPRQIVQALEHVESLCTFAYEQGFHELGYDPVETLRAAIASGSVVCRAADEWQSMSTVPDCDDELWFCRGDTFEGPRAPRMDDVDYWDWWCYAVPPYPPAPPKEQPGGGG